MSFFASFNLESRRVLHSLILITMDGEGGGEDEGEGGGFCQVLSPLLLILHSGLAKFKAIG